jgi:hypothetical protein
MADLCRLSCWRNLKCQGNASLERHDWSVSLSRIDAMKQLPCGIDGK